jgi:hypothetical protein
MRARTSSLLPERRTRGMPEMSGRFSDFGSKTYLISASGEGR